jgi:hypothetical protein
VTAALEFRILKHTIQGKKDALFFCAYHKIRKLFSSKP